MALDIAQGEYYGFVDSDDYIEPEMYETLYRALMDTQAEVAMCGSYWASPDYSTKVPSLTLESQVIWYKEEIRKSFLTTLFPGTSACDKLFSKHLFNDENKIRFPHGYICEDVPTLFELMFKCESLVHVAKPFYNYYQRQGSTSRGAFSEKTYGLIKYPKEIREKVKQEYDYLSEEADYFYSLYVFNFLLAIDPKCARKEYKKYRKELLSYKKVFFKYAPKQQKRFFTLFKFNMFYLLRRIKRILKR